MDTDGRAEHPNFGEKTGYIDQRAVLVCKKSLADDLMKVLSKALGIAQDSRTTASWDDVFEQMRNTPEVYDARAGHNVVRRWLRQGKPMAKILDSLTDLIPDEKGLGALKAGLSFIFKAWSQHIENRENILQVLSDIPVVLCDAVERMRVYRHDQRLQACTQDLYVVIMEALVVLVEILLRTQQGSPWQRFRRRLPDNEAGQVDEIVHRIENAKQRLSSALEIAGHERLAAISQDSQAIRRDTAGTREKVFHVDANLSTLNRSMEATGRLLSSQISSLPDSIGAGLLPGLQDAVSQALRGLVLVSPSTLVEVIQSGLWSMQAEDRYGEGLGTRGATPPPKQLQYIPAPTATMAAQWLLNSLSIEPLLSIRDAESILRQSNFLCADAIERARWLLSTPQFKCWMARPASGLLMVDGHCRDRGIGRTTPLSVFCASFVAALAASPAHIVLHFFCGKHCAVDDPIGGAPGLVRSLAAQLLACPGLGEPLVDLVQEPLLAAVSAKDILALCFVLEQLVYRAPPSKVIYCIIDSVSDFEMVSDEWALDIRTVISHLRLLVDRTRPGPMLKLLMTCANRNMGLADMIRADAGELVALRTGQTYHRPIQCEGFASDARELLTLKQQPVMMLTPARNFEEPWFESPQTFACQPERPQ